MKKSLFIFCVFLLLSSCTEIQKVSDAIIKPTAREVFERSFKENDSLYKRYQNSYAVSKENKLKIEIPSVIFSKTVDGELSILSYTLSLKRGERLRVETKDSLKLIIDLFPIEKDYIVKGKPIISNMPNNNWLSFETKKDAIYKLVIFSENKNNVSFNIKIYTEPIFEFPVSNKSNKAIQSFWGASRSGGKRKHEGIDIFAKRGTPILAATDGYISSTRNRGLGGKQVWLRTGLFGNSLYYAHLDSVVVSNGKSVRTGDTLGFVGNTGNARTTKPHLHFGIYTNNGAINPLPFVKKNVFLTIKSNNIFKNGITKLQKNQLRIGAGIQNKKIMDLERGLKVKVLSKTKNWLHVKVLDSLQGFIHESLIREVE